MKNGIIQLPILKSQVEDLILILAKPYEFIQIFLVKSQNFWRILRAEGVVTRLEIIYPFESIVKT